MYASSAASSSSSSSSSASSLEPPAQRFALAAESELRVEVRAHCAAQLRLVSGSAEVGGVELAEGRAYWLAPGRQLAVFSWYGAELTLQGAPAPAAAAAAASAAGGAGAGAGAGTGGAGPSAPSAYVVGGEESHVPLYANLHQRLEARRDEARLAIAAGGAGAAAAGGPRVLVVGPQDSGKSTLCRTLCAYACRVGRAPTLVDLDIGQGEVSLPGTLAATPLDRACLSVEEASGFAQTTPLAFAFGHLTPGELAPVYRNFAARLADTVNRRLAGDEAARVAGLVVNTMGWVDGAGYELLLEAVRLFAADVVVVLGHDRLFAQLAEDVKGVLYAPPPAPGAAGAAAALAAAVAAGAEGGGGGAGGVGGGGGAGGVAPSKAVVVVKLPRSGGALERPTAYRRAARAARFREYFYGPLRAAALGGAPALSPEVVTVRFEDVVILKVGGAPADPGLVPIGRVSTLLPLRTQAVVPTASLVNHVLAVSFAATEAQVPHVNVAGFVHVRAVKLDARTLSLMVPCGGPLPGRFLLLGSSTWHET